MPSSDNLPMSQRLCWALLRSLSASMTVSQYFCIVSIHSHNSLRVCWCFKARQAFENLVNAKFPQHRGKIKAKNFPWIFFFFHFTKYGFLSLCVPFTWKPREKEVYIKFPFYVVGQRRKAVLAASKGKAVHNGGEFVRTLRRSDVRLRTLEKVSELFEYYVNRIVRNSWLFKAF